MNQFTSSKQRKNVGHFVILRTTKIVGNTAIALSLSLSLSYFLFFFFLSFFLSFFLYPSLNMHRQQLRNLTAVAIKKYKNLYKLYNRILQLNNR